MDRNVNLPGREAAHTLPSSAHVKEYVALYLHPQYIFMAWCLVKITEITLPYLNVDFTEGNQKKAAEVIHYGFYVLHKFDMFC
jgi:hypothetical protein